MSVRRRKAGADLYRRVRRAKRLDGRPRLVRRKATREALRAVGESLR